MAATIIVTFVVATFVQFLGCEQRGYLGLHRVYSFTLGRGGYSYLLSMELQRKSWPNTAWTKVGSCDNFFLGNSLGVGVSDGNTRVKKKYKC